MDPTFGELFINGSKAIIEFKSRNDHEECFSNFQAFSVLQILLPLLVAYPIFKLRSFIFNAITTVLPHWQLQNQEKMVESIHQVIVYG